MKLVTLAVLASLVILQGCSSIPGYNAAVKTYKIAKVIAE